MVAEEKPSPQQGSDTKPSATGTEKGAAEQVNREPSVVEANDGDGKREFLPTPEEQIDALGIPNWRDLEKQVVKRLDMTLMPCLWVLYLFNYLDRASIA